MFKVIKAFLAGLTVGILCAPQSGAKTRKKISDIFSDYKDDAKDYIVDVIDTVESKVHSVKKSVEEM